MIQDWRLAFMFNAQNGAFETMEKQLLQAANEIKQLAGDAHVRLGVADHNYDPGDDSEYDAEGWHSVDGAVEISVAASRRAELPKIAGTVGYRLNTIADTNSIEVMAGPFYPMVPVRDGATFLSLAFRRDPNTTLKQFQTWWHDQHAGVAIPVLGPGLLAYDQVHVDGTETEKLANALGITPARYDAYDNLTWPSLEGFLQSISDPEGMARVNQDEIGRIDKSSYRHALMRKLG